MVREVVSGLGMLRLVETISSASSETRRPMVASMTLAITNVSTNEKMITDPIATTWSSSNSPPPKNTPSWNQSAAGTTASSLMPIVGEEGEQESADHSPTAVHTNDIERIVVTEARLEANEEVATDAGHQAEDDAGEAADEPAAGVIATSAATIPEAAPRVVAWPSFFHSIASQPIMPAAAATKVLSSACTAWPLAAPADPALNPNHPNHKMPVPSMTSGRLCGGTSSAGHRDRLPSTRHEGEGGGRCVDVDGRPACKVERTHFVVPAVVHPVGDRRVDDKHPDGYEHHPCANRMRSATAPEMSAGVIDANVIKNATKIRTFRIAAHVVQTDLAPVADEVAAPEAAAVARVAQRPGNSDPQQWHDADAVHVHVQHVEHVLGAVHAAVEQCQSGHHEHDQGGRNQHPSEIA